MLFIQLHQPLHVPDLFYQSADRQFAGHIDKDAMRGQAAEIFQLHFERTEAHGDRAETLHDPLFHQRQLGKPDQRQVGLGVWGGGRSIGFGKTFSQQPDLVGQLFVGIEDELIFVGGKLFFIVLVENGGHRFYRLLHVMRFKDDAAPSTVRQNQMRKRSFGLQTEDIDRLAGIEGMGSFQQDQLPHVKGLMKGSARIVGHGLVVDLFRQAAGDA